MIIRDRFGWPVTSIEGKPITGFIRKLIHGSIAQTWRRRKEPYPYQDDSPYRSIVESASITAIAGDYIAMGQLVTYTATSVKGLPVVIPASIPNKG